MPTPLFVRCRFLMPGLCHVARTASSSVTGTVYGSHRNWKTLHTTQQQATFEVMSSLKTHNYTYSTASMKDYSPFFLDYPTAQSDQLKFSYIYIKYTRCCCSNLYMQFISQRLGWLGHVRNHTACSRSCFGHLACTSPSFNHLFITFDYFNHLSVTFG